MMRESLPLLPLLLTSTPLFPSTVKRLTVDLQQKALYEWALTLNTKSNTDEASLRLLVAPRLEDLKLGTIDSRGDEIAVTENGLVIRVCRYSCLARVVSVVRDRGKIGDSLTLFVMGIARYKIQSVNSGNKGEIPRAQAQAIDNIIPQNLFDPHFLALQLSVKQLASNLVKILAKSNIPPALLGSIKSLLTDSPAEDLPDILMSFLDGSLDEAIDFLKIISLVKRYEAIAQILKRQIQVLQLAKEIKGKVSSEIETQQRIVLLRRQLDTIKRELALLSNSSDQDADTDNDLEKLTSLVKALPPNVSRPALKDLARLKRLPAQAADAGVLLNYLETLVSLPFDKRCDESLNLDQVRRALETEHYGLGKVKQRILEWCGLRKIWAGENLQPAFGQENLAPTEKKNAFRSPILCLVGPPGVGKTSLAQSISRALNRPLQRVSLGGVRDESELRGHRRTYVGAMPGVLISALRQLGVKNGTIILDEIDKMSKDVRGDPASVLLEVLDPEQNQSFVDHYLKLPFDLSEVLFIATANSLESIPSPLIDRMEIIQISSYTSREKFHICKQYLIPKQLQLHGLLQKNMSDKLKLTISDGANRRIIDDYTTEAGVRNLDRAIASIMRQVVLKAVEVKHAGLVNVVVTEQDLVGYLGQPHRSASTRHALSKTPGVAVGLAFTTNGGECLVIESVAVKGRGEVLLTGKLGDVIKESARIGLTWLRANQFKLNLPTQKISLDSCDVHIHLPQGSIPKDGPSAGVTIVASLVSLFLNTHLKQDVAMTGEITLSGQVLPVGGVKEKLIAAHREGIKTVIIPKMNIADLDELPQDILRDLSIVGVERIEEVLECCFGRIAFAIDPALAMTLPGNSSHL